MLIETLKRLDSGAVKGTDVEINLEQICMVGNFYLESKIVRSACVIALANGQVCAVEISRADLKKKMTGYK